MPYTLYSCNFYRDAEYPTKEAVAEFGSVATLKKYVEDVTLERFPNGNRRFRRDSLLGAASYFEYEEKPDIRPLPFNPAPPTGSPNIEYIVIDPGNSRYGHPLRINCGRYYESAEKELVGLSGEAYIEERMV